MHTIERQRDQLRIAGIIDFPAPDLSWLTNIALPELPKRFALIVPGAAPSRPGKRWPAAHFAELAAYLDSWKLTPIVIGTQAEAPLAAIIRAACPGARDFTGQTSIAQIFALAARASVAVGNDTGPMHIAAAVGCKSVVLFSGESNPDMTAPRGPDGKWPIVLREPVLADLAVARVALVLP
jgi:ADP-heptose:LPS heptosyltransferase